MRKIIKIFCGFLIAVIFCAGAINVSAAQVRSTDSFTHRDTGSGSQISVSMPDVYEAKVIIDERSLGLEKAYGRINDIACDEKGNCYILSEDGIIVEFDSNYNFVTYHTPVSAEGEAIDVAGSSGILATNGELYIADTLHNRVLVCADGVVTKEIIMPVSALIPSDFVFSPTKVARDSKGYIYIISEGSYYGAVMYDPQGEFIGFYGANTVGGGVLSTLSYIWDSLTQNDIKRAKKVKTLPYQFVDICIDNDDFVYTCTGITSSSNTTGQIRMLSPGGTNILYRRQYNGVRTGSEAFAFGESDYAKRLNSKINQDFESIQTDDNGFIYALDLTYGLVYIYDTDCNLLCAFGGGRNNGTQKGLFCSAISLAICGDKVYVADAQNNNVTVFGLTEFGSDLLTAQKKTLDSKYSESKPFWQNVLKYDSYNQLALRGMAKISYIEKNYDDALKYAKDGMDYVIYGQALKQLQAKFITNNFTWLFIGTLFLLTAIILLVIYTKKKNIKIIKNQKIAVMLNGFIHPFESYNAIRYKNMGSLPIAIFMTVLFFVSNFLSVLCCNFRYTSFDKSSFNSLFQIVKTVGLIILWSLANWGISVLLHGIGKFKHVFIVTAYSTLPLIVYNILSIPLSHLLTTPTSVLLNGMEIVAMIWTGIVICVGLMVVHDFNFPRFAATVLIGLSFMFLIVFLIFVFGILITQLWSFIVTIFMEVVYR